MQNKLYYGAAYYPELWDEQAWQEDLRYMKEAGINVVRMGEFAWARMEPVQDQIDVSFFAERITELHKHGIDTIMCTPTPTPPIWMSHGHPERMYVDGDGQVMVHGARQHVCTNNAFFRERSAIIVEALARAVGSLPGVIGWQTDNEFKCHVAECMCDTCKEQWHEWLERKYGTIGRLNEAWGTQIWSEAYLSFDQVPQPRKTPFLHNASLITAYRIFSREKIAEYQDLQLDMIRKFSKAPITHNTGLGFALDNELIFRNLDFASFDDYPDARSYTELLLKYDLFRNMKKGIPFWVMETSTSHNGYLSAYHATHPNGFLRAEAVAAYVSGAQGFSYWLWRQQRAGCELPHGAVLSSWGKPTVGYRGVLETRDAIAALEPLLLETVVQQAELAAVYSDRARSFLLTEPLEGINYRQVLREWTDLIRDMGIHRDLLPEGGDLSGYKILMTPYLPHVPDEFRTRAERFVREGGIWIVGPMTGYRTGEHTVPTTAALGELEALAGVETLYSYPIGDTGSTGHAFGAAAALGRWAHVFDPAESSAQVVGVVQGGPSDEAAFITERRVGQGRIVMLGAAPLGDEGKELIRRLVEHYAGQGDLTLRLDVTPGTLAVPRIARNGAYKLWCLVNMNGKGGEAVLPSGGTDALTGETVQAGRLAIQPYEYRMIRMQ
ncbi:beta-galactosidase [Paenibacillus sp. y28]|uniref:beta-galactosidase n=1 Tax=Paenibacillus sp. y28 TaxID=3129110 RepID=UPI00301AE920